jgi:hypothetical protein
MLPLIINDSGIDVKNDESNQKRDDDDRRGRETARRERKHKIGSREKGISHFPATNVVYCWVS